MSAEEVPPEPIGQPADADASPKPKRPIDRLRDSAVTIQIGTPDDKSLIKEMIVIDGVMHVVKGKGIYKTQLADDIDPGRNNASVPNTQQRVLAFGADCEFVWKTLLTARRLFKTKLLGASFNYDGAVALTFEALKDIVAMHEMALQLAADLQNAADGLRDVAQKDHGLTVPAIGDVRVRVETFLQKADHAVADLFEIAKLFYPNEVGKKRFDSLLVLATAKYGPDAQFTKFLNEALPLLRLVRNARNCVEHPKSTERLEVFDISLLASKELRPPVLEIIHPESAHPVIEVTAFMKQLTEQLAGIFELMLCFLCAFNIQPFAGLSIQVVPYPPDLQKAFGVRYGYGMIYADGQMAPFG